MEEIIVVDGFSLDDTEDIATQYGAKVIETAGTQSSARNVGIGCAQGDYILLVDSDQWLSRFVVEECVERCLGEGCDAVKIPELFFGSNFWGRCSAFWKNNMVEAWGPQGGIPRFYTKQALLQSSGYVDGLRVWDDLELYQRAKHISIKKEGWCKSRVFHHEMASLRDVVRKYVSYGRSLANFKRSSRRPLYRSTVSITMLTAIHILKRTGRSPRIFFGCLFQNCVKTICLVLGFVLQSGVHKE